MSTPILSTKLYTPSPRPNLVLRPRLSKRLNEGLHRKLTLVAAPAGFGKTTLVSAWVASFSSESKGLSSELRLPGQPQNTKLPPHNFDVAWLSLDEADSDPPRFLAYLAAALQTIAPTVGAGWLDALRSTQPPPIDVMLTALLNELTAIPEHFVLVLDDYHVIDSEAVDSALTFLLDHMPRHMHLVITTREDPQFPLTRLRVRDQMTELRAVDLRFTPAEAAAFLKEVMGLDLAAEEIAALEERTEGWIAGLQLAALSMRGRDDIGQFVRAFAGDNRYIVDYLVEEVLQRLPDAVRSFLLQTAILSRLHGPLCDAVTGQQRGQAQLEALEHGNFFVVPLDDTRQWYRYHHLFAGVLAAHVRAEQPEQIATLHRRASVWYAENGFPADAIGHALAARDRARVAGLIELAAPDMLRRRQEATLLGWLAELPADVIALRPVLSAYYAHTLLSNGKLEHVEAFLRTAERWLDTAADGPARSDAPAPQMIVVDHEAFRRLPGTIAVARAGHALALGDLAKTLTYARRVLDFVPLDEHRERGAATALLGLASWASGDLAAAHQSFAEGMAHLQRAGNIADAIGGTLSLADIRITQGRLRDAMHTYERGLRLAAEHGEPLLRGTADMLVGKSDIEREQNNLAAAALHLLRSHDQGEHTGFPQHPYRWRVAMARLRQAEGDLAGALALLDEAERRYVGDFFPNVRPIAAFRARLWLADGHVGEALGWARAQGLSAQDELSYRREFEHITLARVLLAQHQRDPASASIFEAIELLARLLLAAEAGERSGNAIEILVLLALAHQTQGDIPAALVALGRALALAEPEGYVRMFVDEGAPMAELLRAAHERTIAPAYVARLLAAFPPDHRVTGGPGERAKAIADPLASRSPGRPLAPALAEPLSERERGVLRLLGAELNGPEIARELTISLNTLRTHTKNIYAKLGVNSRQAAVRRAKELDLL
jgi:LuxR family maltose regulon positive regulatory protein